MDFELHSLQKCKGSPCIYRWHVEWVDFYSFQFFFTKIKIWLALLLKWFYYLNPYFTTSEEQYRFFCGFSLIVSICSWNTIYIIVYCLFNKILAVLCCTHLWLGRQKEQNPSSWSIYLKKLGGLDLTNINLFKLTYFLPNSFNLWVKQSSPLGE